MPNKDGTGPEGKGPGTGRQRGNCQGAQPVGRGPCGCGNRNGRGRRREFQVIEQKPDQ